MKIARVGGKTYSGVTTGAGGQGQTQLMNNQGVEQMASQLQSGDRGTLTLIMSDSHEREQPNQLHGFMIKALNTAVARGAFLAQGAFVETTENAFLEKMVSEMAGQQKGREEVVRELAGAGATGMLVTYAQIAATPPDETEVGRYVIGVNVSAMAWVIDKLKGMNVNYLGTAATFMTMEEAEEAATRQAGVHATPRGIEWVERAQDGGSNATTSLRMWGVPLDCISSRTLALLAAEVEDYWGGAVYVAYFQENLEENGNASPLPLAPRSAALSPPPLRSPLFSLLPWFSAPPLLSSLPAPSAPLSPSPTRSASTARRRCSLRAWGTARACPPSP